MNDTKANLYDCKHCGGAGTCSTGKDGMSCLSCVKQNDLKGKDHFGLMCGSCGGIGKAEPMTERMNKRISPLLALYLSAALLVIISLAAFTRSPYFSELLAFSSAIIGTICGYYFSSKTNT